MTQEEITQRIAELEPQEAQAWTEAQEYEKSEEYLKPHAHLEALYARWSDLHKKIDALKMIVKDMNERQVRREQEARDE